MAAGVATADVLPMLPKLPNNTRRIIRSKWRRIMSLSLSHCCQLKTNNNLRSHLTSPICFFCVCVCVTRGVLKRKEKKDFFFAEGRKRMTKRSGQSLQQLQYYKTSCFRSLVLTAFLIFGCLVTCNNESSDAIVTSADGNHSSSSFGFTR